eukprot:SM000194S04818  [mRNA]  locus=s194:9196:10940:- [translate_table: standard]
MQKREEELAKAAETRLITEQGELAVLSLDIPLDRVSQRPLVVATQYRPPMLQVVRLASFQQPLAVPPLSGGRKSDREDGDEGDIPKPLDAGALLERSLMEARREVAVAGGGIQVAASRLPLEQRRPVGPLIVVGVRDGVLWLVDSYFTAHAIALSHPGVRCRCLCALGDAVGAVKWASRLSREHHDDLALFLVGMGHAKEALHLPGLSRRLEVQLAIRSNDLPRALQCLVAMAEGGVKAAPAAAGGEDADGLLALVANEASAAEAVAGVAKFATEFLDLVDRADATANAEVAAQALRKLAVAGSVEGALESEEQRGLALRLATHGDNARLQVVTFAKLLCLRGLSKSS